jgi:CheY-like chemotaxis protein
MPVMDGYEATGRIRALEDPLGRTPIIALTASAMAGDRERFLGLGFDDHVGKPVKPMDLIAAIIRAVNPEPPDEGLLRGAA